MTKQGTAPHPHRFQWHPDARAFAGDQAISPDTNALPARVIATQPTDGTLQQLAAALATGKPFCVADQAIRDIGTLAPSQFATQTGGTSGAPKIITRSQSSWISSFHANATQFSYTSIDSIAVLGGLGHSLTLYGVLEGLHMGLDVHALNPHAPSSQAAHMRLHNCSIIYATPTQLRLLPASTPLLDVRLILCGGGTLNTITRQHIANLCPNAALHVFYGAAETSFVTLGGPDTPHGSVGATYPGVHIDIRNPDATGIGTVWVNSPYLSDGYLQGNSPHTQRSGDWMTVGEQGWLDAQGNLFLRGRAGRTVTIADDTIHLDALEAQISELPDLPAFVLMTRPDTLRGHHLVAVVEGPTLTKIGAEIGSFCAQHRLHSPRDVTFLDPLPLLPSGKPDLQRIAALTGTSI